MTGTDADLELVVAAVEAELDRDWEAYMARWSSPAGIADDAPAPPQRYTTSPLRIARAARKAVLAGLMEPSQEAESAGYGAFLLAKEGAGYAESVKHYRRALLRHMLEEGK